MSGAATGPLRGRGTDDQRSDERRHLFQLGVVDLCDLEALGFDRIERPPVAVTAGDELVKAVEAVLPAGKAGFVRANMLDEEQPTAWANDSA